MTRFTFFTICLFSIFSYSNIQAQTDCQASFAGPIPPGTIIIDDQDNDKPIAPVLNIDLDENCIGTVYINIFVANLIPSIAESGAFIFPPGTTPLNLYYNIHNATAYVPVTSSGFSYYDMHEESCTPIFRKAVPVVIDFSNTCSNADGGIDPSLFVDYDMQLIEDNGNNYPFQSNDGDDQIFDCEAFCNSCSASCSPSQSYWTGTFRINCGRKCFNKEDSEPSRDRSAQNDEDVTNQKIISSIESTPNPFTSILNIAYESHDNATSELTIYTVNGELVLSRKLDTTTGSNRAIISTDQWSAGMYYGQIKTNNQTQSFKVIKVN